jgi:cytochrome b subunit of formate dehydrogenase
MKLKKVSDWGTVALFFILLLTSVVFVQGILNKNLDPAWAKKLAPLNALICFISSILFFRIFNKEEKK